MAAPTIENGQLIQFTAADQETTSSFTITCIAWMSAASSEITASDGFLLEDGAGNAVCSAEATTVTESVVIPIPGGITVTGLKAEDLDNGYLYIYGKRR